jgi:predicted MFS family arabinose efflux permease
METGLGAASFSFIAFIVTMILLPESLPDRSGFVQTKRKILNTDAILKAFKNPNLAILISLFFILTFSFANIYGTFALLGLQVYGFTDLQNGYMFGIIGFSSAMVQGGLIGPITKFLGKKKILIVGSFLIMITLALIPYAGNFLWLAVVGIFLSLGTGMLQPTLLSLISEVASEAEQGITLGVNQSLSALARMFGPLWGGFAFEFFGYPFPFLTGAAFMFLIVLAAIFYIPKRIKFSV